MPVKKQKPYKLSQKPTDPLLSRLFTEAEDNFASTEALDSKQNKEITFQHHEPHLREMEDGDIKYYDNGTEQYRYTRLGSRLFIENIIAGFTAGTGVVLTGGGGGSSLVISSSGSELDEAKRYAFFCS